MEELTKIYLPLKSVINLYSSFGYLPDNKTICSTDKFQADHADKDGVIFTLPYSHFTFQWIIGKHWN